jgi:predicted RNA binding protein YcfA (HicA-like mRNA interferase family)
MKNRILKSRLSKAGFVRLTRRGKGSHSIWRHPFYPIAFIQSGKDNRDAKPYQLKQLKKIKLVLNQIIPGNRADALMASIESERAKLAGQRQRATKQN